MIDIDLISALLFRTLWKYPSPVQRTTSPFLITFIHMFQGYNNWEKHACVRKQKRSDNLRILSRGGILDREIRWLEDGRVGPSDNGPQRGCVRL